MAVVTFGGAYAVLAYVAQEAVRGYHWLSPAGDAGRAGPRRDHARPADPGAAVRRLPRRLSRARGVDRRCRAASLGSLLTLWVTFAPCFVFVFLGAPFVERLQSNTALTGALAAVTAAVVGVVAQPRGLVRAARAVPGPSRGAGRSAGTRHARSSSIDLGALALAAVAAVCLFRLKLGVLRTLGITAALGWLCGS